MTSWLPQKDGNAPRTRDENPMDAGTGCTNGAVVGLLLWAGALVALAFWLGWL
jgi:hypothetical protein